MARKEKLFARLLSRPNDFTWNELKRLLEGLGFELLKNKGSKRKFIHREKEVLIILHEPHPDKIIKMYIIDQVIEKLEEINNEE